MERLPAQKGSTEVKEKGEREKSIWLGWKIREGKLKYELDHRGT